MRHVLLFLGIIIMPAPGTRAGEENWQVHVTLGKDGWMRYENPRFGFVIPVPPGMTPVRPPENGDGQSFTAAEGKVGLTAWGSFNVDNFGDLAKRWEAELAEKGRKVTYQRRTDTWFVISGQTDEGTGFYLRYTADASYCAGWQLTYPQKDEKKYAPWIERIAGGYEARLGKGDDTR